MTTFIFIFICNLSYTINLSFCHSVFSFTYKCKSLQTKHNLLLPPLFPGVGFLPMSPSPGRMRDRQVTETRSCLKVWNLPSANCILLDQSGLYCYQQQALLAKSAAHSLFATRDSFCEDNFSMDQGWGGWFGDDTSTLLFLCTLFLLLLHQLQLRSLGIRYWGLVLLT